MEDNMRLSWQQQKDKVNRWHAETVRFRFILIAPQRDRPTLWVQGIGDDWGTNSIDERECRSVRHAERLAQRFENSTKPRRLV